MEDRLTDPQPSQAPPAQETFLTAEDDASWRKEVSDRLNRYQARRRPRPPRYPSLSLKFDAPEARWASTVREANTSPAVQAVPQIPSVVNQAVAVEYVEPAPALTAAPQTATDESRVPVQRASREGAGKLIEFPRTMYTHPASLSDLAEPILDRPRILEAPELLPPPPALGGMTIEEAEKPAPERRLGIDMPLQSAPIGRRLQAGAIDAAVVLMGAALFGAVFYRVTGATMALKQMAIIGGGLLFLFWAAYQYLLIVYSGTTAGLRALQMHVQRFDGHPANRKLRRTRVLCALLSAASLGLGYAWHFLDEDRLCWHERVTKTHISPKRIA